MRQTGHKEPYLNFLRELCIGMLTEHGTKPVRRRSVVARRGQEAQLQDVPPQGEDWLEVGLHVREVRGSSPHSLLQAVPHKECYGAVNISFGCSSYALRRHFFLALGSCIKKQMKMYFFIFEPFYPSFYQLLCVQSIKGCFRYKWLLKSEYICAF